ncbi:MAG: hypothetical protein GF365_05350 [Candidatus Buchananbacteria bacterium]|nr:hypothetical protein [Candidatus Buchananbacteria bacterium]
MKKLIYFIVISLVLVLLPNNTLAFESNAIVNLHAPYDTFLAGTFDDLVLDFTLISLEPDVVRAISLRNRGSAGNFNHIKYMTLWVDDGPLGFQGMGIDRVVGDFDYSSGFKSWYIDNLSESIDDSLHFYVSIETYSLIEETGTIQMQIPALLDVNNNNSFDVGDFGIFLDSGNNGPTDKNLTNNSNQVVSNVAYDETGPKLVIINLTDNDFINNDHFLIKGLARDQGNHGLKAFAIKINDQLLAITNYNVLPYQWTYDWQNIKDGEYTLSLQAYDDWGNFSQTAPITVNVVNQEFSPDNSDIVMNNTTITNSGLDPAMGIIKLRDTGNQPIANWSVDYTADPGLFVNLPNNLSDKNGEIEFDVYSVQPGLHNIKFSIDQTILGQAVIKVVEPGLADTDIDYGDLIKASTQAVYYYGADGKRYVFPSQGVYLSWYDDFSQVKKITDQQLALIPIGGNVTYKPGVYLVKITTEPKVYAVDQDGQLKWITSENIANSVYGNNWQQKIKDVPDVFFTDYELAGEIKNSEDYNPGQLIEQIKTINQDKGLL